MGKISGKPGPDPRSPGPKISVHPYGGPSRPPLKELTKREAKRLKGYKKN